MGNKKIWYLQRINLFKTMSIKEMMAFAKMVEMQEFGKGDTIFVPGQPGEVLYLLKKGNVKLCRINEDGRIHATAFLKPGEVFGELEAVEGVPRETLAVAHKKVMLCVLSRDDLLGLLAKKPSLSLSLTKLMGFRRRKFENKVDNLLFRTVPARLAYLIGEFAADFGQPTLEGVRIDLPLTHQDWAVLAGATRQTISEVLMDFRTKGLVATTGKYLTVIDPEALRAAI